VLAKQLNALIHGLSNSSDVEQDDSVDDHGKERTPDFQGQILDMASSDEGDDGYKSGQLPSASDAGDEDGQPEHNLGMSKPGKESVFSLPSPSSMMEAKKQQRDIDL